MTAKNFFFIFLLILPTISFSKTNEPILTIALNRYSYTYTKSALLSTHIYYITMNNNRAYPGKRMTYTSIKLCELLKPYSIASTDMIEFEATDGFSVLIPAKKIMSCSPSSAIGYLAIEPKQQWPKLDNYTNTTAGPFAVIWERPEKSYISNEYWAWSVSKITVHKTISQRLVINKPLTDNQAILKGHNLYISHCAGCHSINHIGKGKIGPDLNWPKNPTEYYPNDKQLRKFIRSPQSLRKGRMSGSGEDFLSHEDLNKLILYFHYMAKHK